MKRNREILKVLWWLWASKVTGGKKGRLAVLATCAFHKQVCQANSSERVGLGSHVGEGKSDGPSGARLAVGGNVY